MLVTFPYGEFNVLESSQPNGLHIILKFQKYSKAKPRFDDLHRTITLVNMTYNVVNRIFIVIVRVIVYDVASHECLDPTFACLV